MIGENKNGLLELKKKKENERKDEEINRGVLRPNRIVRRRFPRTDKLRIRRFIID